MLVIVALCLLPSFDYIVSNAIYMVYSSAYYECIIPENTLKVSTLSFSGAPYRGEANLYESHGYSFSISPSDKGYQNLEFDDGLKVVSGNYNDGGVVTKNELTGEYVIKTSETKMLNLLFRERTAVRVSDRVEVAKYKYIAEFAVVVPFFSSFWQTFFLADSERNKRFGDFDKLVFEAE